MRLICLLSLLYCGSLFAQLSNRSFLFGSDPQVKKFALGFEGLQFLKNNEYYNNINPGQTFFGFQFRGLAMYRVTDKAMLTAGIFAQHEFGDNQTFSKVIPIFNLQLTPGKWKMNFGNITPHVHHGLIEPLLNYENIISQPIEGGLQTIRSGKRSRYDMWLEWRQLASELKGRQEKIVFGNHYNIRVLSNSFFSLNIPIQSIIYHEGGQALNIQKHVRTIITGASGLRMTTKDSILILESFVLGSMDNSETLSQPFQNGWASMTNFRFRFLKYNELSVTWWYSREFFSPTGNPVFSNVNYNDVYLNRNTRRLLMFRYVYSRPIVGNKLWIDFRLEPYYDFEYKNVEFAQGLYFRYVNNFNLRFPSWLGF